MRFCNNPGFFAPTTMSDKQLEIPGYTVLRFLARGGLYERLYRMQFRDVAGETAGI